jgi:hypothetical protein
MMGNGFGENVIRAGFRLYLGAWMSQIHVERVWNRKKDSYLLRLAHDC